MRAVMPEVVERGRDGGVKGRGYGSFLLVHPDTGRTLRVIASDAAGWADDGMPGEPWEHVSVSARLGVPRWEEMCWIKDLFWGPDEWVIQYHPAAADYVNVHPNVLHLWKPVAVPIPTPPKVCV